MNEYIPLFNPGKNPFSFMNISKSVLLIIVRGRCDFSRSDPRDAAYVYNISITRSSSF
ncbi:hypothetical protein EZS27_027782 [termite gut metagenome]|uniref:Uncharacterized protein n=1 Tax=termite gut metagenome TaxID=433724 RepID=A0A5J4QMB0_9ZZZZ